MRKFLVSVVVALSAVAVVAYAEVTSIRQDMMNVEKLAKQIKATVADASQNQQNAVNANQIALLMQANLQKFPEIIKQWPADQQPAVVQNYQEHINYALSIAVQMQTAFQNNDNATAAALIQQLFDAKENSHKIYNH
ncbi:hypothetical protein B9G69_000850 [Bdellovibrio sp. SKB1291214]|uniref:hypothetical protein n=1 Tax=Bdellovibrio sp. SKB1291214 TaxID=1732569 RepID=UPI000B5194AA|nr:hypothetical protein [Bdellovibrio sp. SKB1291214]UYL09123.1 hypothetical protein B9G69_000850 [Bdellovibrio sp. SKB1291214]